MSNMHDVIQVEVAYARSADEQWVLPLKLEVGSKAEEAIKASGILELAPEIELDNCALGNFSKKIALDYLVKDGDRVEIYRPLLIDPKAKRLKKLNRK